MKFCGNKNNRHPNCTTHYFLTKNKLMITRSLINRIIILGFMVLVGYCLARAIQIGSIMGVILALTSLGAGVYFLYLLTRAKEEMTALRSETEVEEAA